LKGWPAAHRTRALRRGRAGKLGAALREGVTPGGLTGAAQAGLPARRGVGDYLTAVGGLPARLFLGAPKNAPADAKWTPLAELNLAMP